MKFVLKGCCFVLWIYFVIALTGYRSMHDKVRCFCWLQTVKQAVLNDAYRELYEMLDVGIENPICFLQLRSDRIFLRVVQPFLLLHQRIVLSWQIGWSSMRLWGIRAVNRANCISVECWVMDILQGIGYFMFRVFAVPGYVKVYVDRSCLLDFVNLLWTIRRRTVILEWMSKKSSKSIEPLRSQLLSSSHTQSLRSGIASMSGRDMERYVVVSFLGCFKYKTCQLAVLHFQIK